MNPASSRYLPFAVFMAFIGLDQFAGFLLERGLIGLAPTTLYYLYPIKATTVAILLLRYRHTYNELEFKDLSKIPTTVAVCVMGLLVFLLWIQMDWTIGTVGPPRGFNLLLLPDGPIRIVMVLFRVFGAVLVVPLMEELFWRSFLLRYIINKNFEKVPMGTFTLPSFLVTMLLFGLEHDFILAGMMAGAIYNLILYRTRSLAQCVLAHAVTNLAIAVYVLSTDKWQFW